MLNHIHLLWEHFIYSSGVSTGMAYPWVLAFSFFTRHCFFSLSDAGTIFGKSVAGIVNCVTSSSRHYAVSFSFYDIRVRYYPE